jgi:glycosyltransferase involved in cell wall biosynthesis
MRVNGHFALNLLSYTSEFITICKGINMPGEIEKTRILFVETWSETGGGQKGLLDILCRLDRRIFEPSVILPCLSGSLYDRIREMGAVPIHEFRFDTLPDFLAKREFFPFISPRSVRSLARFFIRNAPHVIHANHIFAAKYACLAARRAGIPCLATMRNVYKDKPWGLHRFVDRMLTRNADAVVFNSYRGRDLMQTRTRSRNIITIHNGVNIEPFLNDNSDRRATLTRYGIPVESKVIIVAARFLPMKGQHVIIEALPSIIARYPGCHVMFAGGGYDGSVYREKLIALAGHAGVSRHCTFIDFTDDIPSLLHSSHVSVLASLCGEGLPRILIESLAAGLPMVASDTDGVPEVCVDGENGFLCPPGDPASFAGSILRVLEMPHRQYENLRQANRIKARQHFDLGKMIQRYSLLYQSLAGGLGIPEELRRMASA